MELRCDTCKKLITPRMQLHSVLTSKGFRVRVCSGCKAAIRRQKAKLQ